MVHLKEILGYRDRMHSFKTIWLTLERFNQILGICGYKKSCPTLSYLHLNLCLVSPM